MDRTPYINVDELQAQTSLEEAAQKCGMQIEPRGNGKEVRIDCPFGCTGDHVGRREIAVNVDNPQKVFLCHAYACGGFRGNLMTLLHGWSTGRKPSGGRLKGDEFNSAKKILLGNSPSPSPTTLPPVPSAARAPAQPSRNVALRIAHDPKTRELANIDAKFVTDVAQMSPSAAAYVRRHPALTSESMQKWRVGYLPHDGGGDKRGWSLRGQIVYPLLSEDGQELAWVGRDPLFEDKLQQFLKLAPDARQETILPTKHKVPKSFHRGLELFGQQASRLSEPSYREIIAHCGVIVVEGMNDVIGLDNLAVPAVAICSNRLTTEQVTKIARWANQLAGGKVALLFDCEQSGDDGAKEALWLLAERGLDVHLGWSQCMHAGRFRGRQPEELTREEWETAILPSISR